MGRMLLFLKKKKTRRRRETAVAALNKVTATFMGGDVRISMGMVIIDQINWSRRTFPPATQILAGNSRMTHGLNEPCEMDSVVTGVRNAQETHCKGRMYCCAQKTRVQSPTYPLVALSYFSQPVFLYKEGGGCNTKNGTLKSPDTPAKPVPKYNTVVSFCLTSASARCCGVDRLGKTCVGRRSGRAILSRRSFFFPSRDIPSPMDRRDAFL